MNLGVYVATQLLLGHKLADNIITGPLVVVSPPKRRRSNPIATQPVYCRALVVLPDQSIEHILAAKPKVVAGAAVQRLRQDLNPAGQS